LRSFDYDSDQQVSHWYPCQPLKPSTPDEEDTSSMILSIPQASQTLLWLSGVSRPRLCESARFIATRVAIQSTNEVQVGYQKGRGIGLALCHVLTSVLAFQKLSLTYEISFSEHILAFCTALR
jgi:hypothetical protein